MSESPLPPNTPSTPNHSNSSNITTGLSFKRHFRPYFTKKQLAILNGLKKSGQLVAKENNLRYTYCKFIQDVGKKVGFPQKTISTAQTLYHRFYLYYSVKDYPPQDISVTCIFVASKIEENIKKLKDIIVAVHSVKHPDWKELDPEQVSDDRRRKILTYEKLLLETLSFDFQLRHAYEYVIKFTKWLKEHHQPQLEHKRLAKKAYDLAVDSYRTLICVEYPAHTVAAGCIYLASKMLEEEDSAFKGLSAMEQWNNRFFSRMEDIEDVAQQILDLYINTNLHKEDIYSFTKIKIALNELTQAREKNENLTRNAKEGSTTYLELDPSSENPLELVNTNHHTVSYHFSVS